MKCLKPGQTRQNGFVVIELLFALILFGIMTAIGVSMMGKQMDSQNYQIAAQQQQEVADAAARYLKDNFATIYASAGTTAPATITPQMLRNTNYLPSGFSDTNAFAQTFVVLARRVNVNQLESIVITTGGQAIDEIGTREIAENIGAAGGFIPYNNSSVVQGVRGGWELALSNYGLNPGVGHTVSALFLQNGNLSNDYLYRNAIPGRPELQRMNAAIDMNGNNIDNAANISARGTVSAGSVNASGQVSGGSITSSGIISGESVSASGQVSAGSVSSPGVISGGSVNASGQIAGGSITAQGSITGASMTSTGSVSGATMNATGQITAGAVNSAGEIVGGSISSTGRISGGTLSSAGRTSIGEFISIESVVSEGGACDKNGLMSKDNSGMILSCQAGAWHLLGGKPKIYSSTYTAAGNTIPGVISRCPSNTTVVGGGGRCNGVSASLALWDSTPNDVGWVAQCRSSDSFPITVVAYSVCQ